MILHLPKHFSFHLNSLYSNTHCRKILILKLKILILKKVLFLNDNIYIKTKSFLYNISKNFILFSYMNSKVFFNKARLSLWIYNFFFFAFVFNIQCIFQIININFQTHIAIDNVLYVQFKFITFILNLF